MARMYSLFSSSKGNVTYIGTEESGLLIDAGVSFRRLSAAMARCGLPLEAVRGVFITHDHADHIGGLRVLAAKLGVPIYAQPVTMRNLIDRDAVPPNARLCAIGGAVQCADMTVTAFETSHDTDQSCGFRVTCADGRSCAVCTDLGVVTKRSPKRSTGAMRCCSRQITTRTCCAAVPIRRMSRRGSPPSTGTSRMKRVPPPHRCS